MRLSRLLDPLRYRLILLRRYRHQRRVESIKRRLDASFARLCRESEAGGGVFRDQWSFFSSVN